MTLADILKPSLTILTHAQLRGIQIGAGAATLSSIPCLLLKPSLINASNDAPLAAAANLAGVGAVTGAVTMALVTGYKMAGSSREDVVARAERVIGDAEERRLVAVSAAGAGVGVGVAVLRVGLEARNNGKCVFGLLSRRQTPWEVFAFGVMGVAVGTGVYVIGRHVWMLKGKGKGAVVSEVDEGDALVDNDEIADKIVEKMEEKMEEKKEEDM